MLSMLVCYWICRLGMIGGAMDGLSDAFNLCRNAMTPYDFNHATHEFRMALNMKNIPRNIVAGSPCYEWFTPEA